MILAAALATLIHIQAGYGWLDTTEHADRELLLIVQPGPLAWQMTDNVEFRLGATMRHSEIGTDWHVNAGVTIVIPPRHPREAK